MRRRDCTAGHSKKWGKVEKTVEQWILAVPVDFVIKCYY